MQRAVVSGRISTVDGKIDPDVADREWRENTDQSKPRNRITGRPKHARIPGEPSEPMDLGGADEASAERHRHRLRPGPRGPGALPGPARASSSSTAQRGTLVRADEVRLGAFNMARKARDQLIALPERVSPPSSRPPRTPAEVQRILEEEIERICQEIADAERP